MIQSRLFTSAVVITSLLLFGTIASAVDLGMKTDGIRVSGSFECWGFVPDEEDAAIFLVKQAAEHIEGEALHNSRAIPCTVPEKPTVLGAMGETSQHPAQLVYGRAVADSNSRPQSPQVTVCGAPKYSCRGSKEPL